MLQGCLISKDISLNILKNFGKGKGIINANAIFRNRKSVSSSTAERIEKVDKLQRQKTSETFESRFHVMDQKYKLKKLTKIRIQIH